MDKFDDNNQIGIEAYCHLFGWGITNNDGTIVVPNRAGAFLCHPIPRRFNSRPYFVKDKSLSIVGNGIIFDSGRKIDSSDHIIRINSMHNWRFDPQHDGTKATIWAGLPVFAAGKIDADLDVWRSSKFCETARSVEFLWSISPFQCSPTSWQIFSEPDMIRKLVTLPSYWEYLSGILADLPEDLKVIIFKMPKIEGKIGLPLYELLLTGVKTCIASFVEGAREINLFGFDFFESQNYWKHHNIKANIKILLIIEKAMTMQGRKFTWREKERVLKRLRMNDTITD